MAARFWVGGSGTWDASNTANWSATTGGAGGQSVPGASDTVTFDANSGTSFTVTVATGYNPSVVSVTGGAATVTLNLNDQNLTVQTFSFTNALSIARTLAWGPAGRITVTGNSGTVFTTQTDAGLTCSGSRDVYFTYSGGTGTRQIGTPALTNIATNSLNYYIQGGTDIVTLQGPSGIVARNLDLTGFSGTFTTNQMFAYGNITLSAGMTLTATAATWNFRGPSGGTQTLTTAGLTLPVGINVNALGGTVVFADDVTMSATSGAGGTLTLTAGTLNLNDRTVNVGIFSSSNSNVRVLAFGASSTLNITGTTGTIWNCSTTTNLSYTGTQIVNLTGSAAGTRAVTTGTLSESNSVSFNITTGTDTVALDGSFRSIDFTGFSGTLTGPTARTIYGNLTLATGMTVTSSSSATTFAGTGASKTFATNSVVWDTATIINCTNQLLLNGELLLPTKPITVTAGGIDTNGYGITATGFSSSNNNARTIDITNSTVTLAGVGTVWNMSASGNATVIADNSTINFTNNTTTTRVFAGGSLTYGNLVIGGDTSTSTTSFTGNNTFAGAINSTKTVAHTVSFTAGTTTTVGGFGISGSAGNEVTITSLTAAPHNLVFTGGGNVDVSYANISYSNASPSNTWYSLLTNNNTDSGNNTGWIFTLPAASSSNFFLVF